ncbi:AMP-binding protein [Actibacterium lipolyticum]|uniref:Acetyl-coenzyme A synthetase n=1 Tax=Actibacterium lipolyticum TaxID=1524263 RepID=A0A238JMI6_9RHOB|nr:AMP-binding protein [Actibacterium lipolyticum]SMX31407.1 Acetyl-coenzyme A synthetase [Actibacterium lipolyticum]
MPNRELTPQITARVADLTGTYTAPDACAGFLLCDRHPADRVAYRIIGEGAPVDLTFGALKARSEKLASGLSQLGFGPGDRIATLMSKGDDYLVTLLAVWRLGAVYVPLFTAFARGAIEMRLESSRAKLVVCDASQRSKLEGLVGDALPDLRVGQFEEVDCDLSMRAIERSGKTGFPAYIAGGDGAVIEVYTSGTTGKPKGVVVPLRAWAGFQAYGEFGLGLTQGDVFWNAADPGWAYGLYFGVISSLTNGVTAIMHTEKFSADGTLAVLRDQGVTNFTAAPTVYRSLKAHGVEPGGIRLKNASSAGEPLTPDVNEWAPNTLGVEVHDHFGQTEAGMLVNNHHHPDLKRPIKPGSMGQSLPGWDMTVVDAETHEELGPDQPGLLAARLSKSPFAWFSGYRSAPEKNAERLTPCGRWYLTGDLAKYDAEGSFRFSSRDDDVIIMAGYRIGPFDIESVISTHPAVREVAVVAVPDEIRGEVLEAVVVLNTGSEPSDVLSDEIKQKVRTDYATYAYPRRVHYREDLPKTPSGKIQRFLIRQDLRRALEVSE